MCLDCFTEEFKSFETEGDWLKLDLDLSIKLSKGKLKYIDSGNGESTYECQTCKEIWLLRDADYSDRGYLKALKSN